MDAVKSPMAMFVRFCDEELSCKWRMLWIAYLCLRSWCGASALFMLSFFVRVTVMGWPAMSSLVQGHIILCPSALSKSVPQGGGQNGLPKWGPPGHALCVPQGGPIFGCRFGPLFWDWHLVTLRNYEPCQPPQH